MPMRGDSKTTQSIIVSSQRAADNASSADRSFPAASVAAGECSIAPHAHSDLELKVSYSSESDVSESEKILEASRPPAEPRLSKDQPNKRTRDMRHSLFGSGEEYGDEYE